MNFNKIPDKLKTHALWCVWKQGKIPCNPRTGKNAQSNIPETFSDFETACNALEKGQYEGLGINIHNGFSAIDIDHCIDEKGELSGMAKDIITKMGSYTEISPSGTGIHIIFTMHDFLFDKEAYYINNQKIGLEVYIAGATKKFITITGNAINDNDIADNPTDLQEILEKYMLKPQSPASNFNSISIPTNSKICYLQIGLEKDKKLIDYWNGNRTLRSESENDMGFMSKLLYWTNGNVDEAIKAFRASPYASQKDPAHQKKMDRLDYLPGLAKKAMPSEFASQSNAEYQNQQKLKKKQEQKKSYQEIKLVSAQDLQKVELPPVRYLIEDLLPQGTSILTAASKIGKSWLVLDMGLQIAAGGYFFNKRTESTGVLYLALEDSYKRLQDRINKILCYHPAPANLHLLTNAPNLENGLLKCLDNILEQNPEIKLIIIDTLQKIRGQAKSRESAYQQDYREMGMIKEFADKREISIFLVHHNRKLVDDSDPFNMISGTNGIMGVADTIFVITKNSRDDKRAVLHITGRDVLQNDIVICFNESTSRWDVIGYKEKIDREEYEGNPIVKTVREILKRTDTWEGTSTALIKEGKDLNINIEQSAQRVGYEIKRLSTFLTKYDRILYTGKTNGNAGRIHQFHKMGMIPYQKNSCVNL